MALKIYHQIIQRYREGSLSIQKENILNTYSFGKENNFASANQIQQISKTLKFEKPKPLRETPKNSNTKYTQRGKTINKLTNQNIIKNEQTLMVINFSPQIQLVTHRLIKLNMRRLIYNLSLNNSFNKLTKIKRINNKNRFMSKLKLFHRIIKMKNFIVKKAQSFYNTNLLRKSMYIIKINNKSQFKKSFQSNQCSFQVTDESNSKDFLFQNKILKFNGLIFIKRFNEYHSKIVDSYLRKQKIYRFNYKMFFTNLKKQKIKNCFKKQQFRLSSMIKNNKIKKIYKNLREFTKNYSNKIQNHIHKIKFLFFFLTRLNELNLKLGFNYEWMKKMDLFQKQYQIKKQLEKCLLKKCFTELIKNLKQEKLNQEKIKNYQKYKTIKIIIQRIKLLKNENDNNIRKNTLKIRIQKQRKFYSLKKLKNYYYFNNKLNILYQYLAQQKKKYVLNIIKFGYKREFYVNSKKQIFLNKINSQNLKKYFNSIKNYLLTKIYYRRLLGLFQNRKNKIHVKRIFRTVKQYYTLKKIMKLKVAHLTLFLKSIRYERFVSHFEKYQILSLKNENNKQKILTQLKKRVNKKCFNYLKLYAEKSKIKAKLYNFLLQTYNNNKSKKIFQVFKQRKLIKQQQRQKQRPNIKKIIRYRKQKIFNLLVDKVIFSIKLKAFQQIMAKVIKKCIISRLKTITQTL